MKTDVERQHGGSVRFQIHVPVDCGTDRACRCASTRLVFGSRNWLKREAAQQPRECMGVGHLHVKRYMRAAWLKPLLSAMGQDTGQRPYKNYFAHYARKAYPALDMGRELLTLNLNFCRVSSLPLEAITGEAKQAFIALGMMPPLFYHAPEDGSPAAPREEMGTKRWCRCR